MIIAVVGSGGKTTHIHHLAKQYISEGKKVFVCTSTHMALEDDVLLCDDATSIIERINANHYVFAGLPSKGKVGALPLATYKQVAEVADVTLIEADGSKQMPLKICNTTEPVIYDNVDEVHVITNLDAVNQKAKDVVFRLELSKSINDETIITYQDIQNLLRENYLSTNIHPRLKIFPKGKPSLLNLVITEFLKEDKDVSCINPNWFKQPPVIILYGAGHVSQEVAYIGHRLGYDITVLDPRHELLNRDYFPYGQLIDSDFSDLSSYLKQDAYHILATPNPKYDVICLSQILKREYDYIGLLCSAKKKNYVDSELRKLGILDNQLNQIHAPIGLDIKAKTPGEIAIAIFGELTQIKNAHQSEYLSKSLLDIQTPGTLCIITKKEGTSPRDVGSMMYVTSNGVIETIGGGSMESMVIQDARKIKEITMKTYPIFDDNKSYVTVLMIPLSN